MNKPHNPAEDVGPVTFTAVRIPLSLCLLFCLLATPLLGGTNHSPAEVRMTMAILFEDRTGNSEEAHWRYTIPRLLGEQLSKIDSLEVRGGHAIGVAFRHFKFKPDHSIDNGQIRRIGEFVQARRVVRGSY